MKTEDVEKLDKVFRKGSDARKVAEIMLDGKPHSRTEIADKAKTSPTQIPRVRRMIEEAGIPIVASVGADGRSTVYQRGGTTAAVDATGQIVSVSFAVPAQEVDVETLSGSYSMQFNPDGSVRVRTPKQEITIV